MPKIPIFQRQRLASQLVGTPRQDTSGQQIAESISSAAAQISDVFKRREIARDETDVTKNILTMNQKIDEADREFKNEFSNDPRGKADLYYDRLNSVIKEDVSAISNKNVAARVNKFRNEMLLKRGLEFNAWSSKRELEIAFSNSVESNNILISNVVNSENITGLEDNLVLQRRVNDDLSQIVSPKEASKVDRDQKKSLMLAYMNSQLDKNPENLLRELEDENNSALFAVGLTPQETIQFKNEAKSKIDKKLEQADQEKIRNAIITHDDIVDKMIKGEEGVVSLIKLRQSEGALDDRSAALLSEIALKRVPNQIKDEKAIELIEKFSIIENSVKEDNVKQSFDKILSFKNDALEDFKNGFITVETFNNMNKVLGKALIESVKKKNGAAAFGENIYEIATETIKDYAKRNNRLDDPRFISEVLNSFIQKTGDQSFKKNRTAEELDEIRGHLQTSIASVLAKENPSLNLASKDTERLLTADGSQKNIKRNAGKPPKNNLNIVSFEKLRAKDGSLWLRDNSTGKRRRATQQEIKELF